MQASTTSKSILAIKALTRPWSTKNPYLFCMYHVDAYPAGEVTTQGPPSSLLHRRQLGNDFSYKDGWSMYHGETVPGFPSHPHRGFETITIVREGLCDHSDSLGATARYGHGDVQWLTAGEGIQHSEMFPLVHDTKGNRLELFQLWLNLPRAKKSVSPAFRMYWAPNIATYTFPSNDPSASSSSSTGKATVRMIAGKVGEMEAREAPPPDSYASEIDSHVAILELNLHGPVRWSLPPFVSPSSSSSPSPTKVTRVLYFYLGKSLKVDDRMVSSHSSIEVDASATVELAVEGEGEEVGVLLLQGKPLDEPVVHYGPFVANSSEEIQKAFSDYSKTQFGGWPWERSDNVHPRETKRFAKYTDGHIEFPPPH